MPPLEALFAEHRRHYEPGTLDRFLSWFERSGHGAMLENPFLRQEHGRGTVLGGNRLSFSRLNGVKFANDGPDPWHIKFTPTLDGSAESVDSLFWNFVRCTAHTHLFG